MRKALVSKILNAPKFRYSQMIKAGPNYVLSGMIAIDKDSGELVDGDAGRQTAKILENLGILIEEFDLAWDDLISARVFTTDFDRFDGINAAWEAVFTEDVTPPARSAVGVSALPLDAAVMIEFSFYRESAEPRFA